MYREATLWQCQLDYRLTTPPELDGLEVCEALVETDKADTKHETLVFRSRSSCFGYADLPSVHHLKNKRREKPLSTSTTSSRCDEAVAQLS